MKVKKRLKSKTDYSQYSMYCFRVSADQKSDLIKRVNEAKTRLNRGKSDDDKVIKKNQIILEALKVGLGQLRRDP